MTASRTRFIPLVPATLLLAALGCGSSSPAFAPSPILPPLAPSAAKLRIHGLVAMNKEGFNSDPTLTPDNSLPDPNANPNVYAASVILVTWKQLQPTGPTSLDTSAIDAGLSAIATYNIAHPSHPMVGKLRIFAGINAPTWVQNLDGPPITANGATYTIPRFWTANYTAAWKALQNSLAAKYDTTALLAEVAVSGCVSNTAEPFVHPAIPLDIPILKAAGFTDTQYTTCLTSMADQYSAWALTPLDYTFNALTRIDTGVGSIDTAFPIALMSTWRSTLGTNRGIIANHGLQTTLTASATPIYTQFLVLGPPLEFQTIGPTVNWDATVAYALTFHPSEIEIWQTTQAGGFAVISLAQLQSYASQI